jgi:hypothetical protein
MLLVSPSKKYRHRRAVPKRRNNDGSRSTLPVSAQCSLLFVVSLP